MPFKVSPIPTIDRSVVEEHTAKYIKRYPKQQFAIQNSIEGALILEKICLDNYEAGGHRFYETRDLFSWNEGEAKWSWNQDKDGNPKLYCQADGSFAHYILTSKSIDDAVKAMMIDLEIVHDHASDIEATAF